MPTPVFVGSGDPDGEVLGRTSGKIGFYGLATPIVQRTGSSMTALTLTTAVSGGFGHGTSAAFAAHIAQIEEIRATLVALGIHAGA
jgi:hypothetical protein